MGNKLKEKLTLTYEGISFSTCKCIVDFISVRDVVVFFKLSRGVYSYNHYLKCVPFIMRNCKFIGNE